MDELKISFLCAYDDKDAIGRRYRRQDALGTPYCITIDFDTLENNTVTMRERDSMTQTRIPIDELTKTIEDKISWRNLFK